VTHLDRIVTPADVGDSNPGDNLDADPNNRGSSSWSPCSPNGGKYVASRAITIAAILVAASFAAHADEPPASLLASGPQFEIHSDFFTNLNDELITTGKARAKRRAELFTEGEASGCFAELAPSARSGWNLAVDWYEEAVSPETWSSRPQVLLRYELSGLEERVDERGKSFVSIARGFLLAAAPAYRECRWPKQDEENREWAKAVAAKIDKYGAAIAKRLEVVYATSWHGLPIRVDGVPQALPHGADTWSLDPGGHILISPKVGEEDGLEVVFHEASHTLMAPWRPDPVPAALDAAAKELDVEVVRDLWHIVLFYSTGQVVRQVLEDAGAGEYTPYMYRHEMWRGSWAPYREAVESSWPAYLGGRRELPAAARDLIRAFSAQERPDSDDVSP